MAGVWVKTREPGIRKRQGAQGASYRYAYRDTDGRLRSKDFRTFNEAKSFKADIRGKKDRGEHLAPALGKITLSEFYERFIGTQQYRPSTQALHATNWALYIKPRLGHRRLSSIHTEDVEGLLAWLRSEGKGPATQRQVHSLLHKIFQVAVSWRYIHANPAALERGRAPRSKRKPITVLTRDQVDEIAKLVPSRYSALIYLLAYAGLRIGEASALRVSNVDLENGIIHVVENSPEVNGRKIPGDPKSEAGERRVRISSSLATKLRAHMQWYAQGSELVFTTETGHPVRQNNFRKRIFQPAAIQAGIKPIPTVHSLRHYAVSAMAEAGMSLPAVARQVGHSTQTMTDLYFHMFDDSMDEKLERLDLRMQGTAEQV